MERREFIALLSLAAAMVPSAGRAESSASEDHRAGDRLAGTWSFVSSINTRRDGTTFDRWGDNPKGIFIFNGGHYAQIIVGGESRVFGAKVFCAFGTYSIENGDKNLFTRIEGCSVSKLSGTLVNRTILRLTDDEFKYSNSLTMPVGSSAEVLWKRVG